MTTRIPGQSSRAKNAPDAGRVMSMQSPLDRVIFHPIAARLARVLAQTRATPNMVSVAGGLMVVFAGIAYLQPGWPGSVLLGLALHMAWHVFDGADGDLARLTGQSSPKGEIVDGLCDYFSHFILYCLLAGAAFAAFGPLAWLLAAAAAVSRIAQASFHEAQRRQYLDWVHGVSWLRSAGISSPAWARSIGSFYIGIADKLAPGDAELEGAAVDPLKREQLRSRLLELGPSPLAGSGLLGATYRTVALGLSMLAGSPVWYFLYEITVLNLALAHAIWRSRKTMRSLRAAL
ncbi:CDP-alcohol phosphatidyltransferase family protein [Pontixanthobacter aquaemixtae]|uniref:CDP-alcohol phosphatidyltransferase n=1 Tax=Pontixanthobacter aquaemixtae TaxID=1958940 RepID=A0A844ZV88_9SPHN|nr:CDP-alcohol phosphatidyltransferase family protein [Pontixanthobacter aquaemixtae]MXO90866.1 CDP-alcohol phosphatidyltransferase [Pontixanthobacter aquaemixtae]